jgi:hypothetical protein
MMLVVKRVPHGMLPLRSGDDVSLSHLAMALPHPSSRPIAVTPDPVVGRFGVNIPVTGRTKFSLLVRGFQRIRLYRWAKIIRL